MTVSATDEACIGMLVHFIVPTNLYEDPSFGPVVCPALYNEFAFIVGTQGVHLRMFQVITSRGVGWVDDRVVERVV